MIMEVLDDEFEVDIPRGYNLHLVLEMHSQNPHFKTTLQTPILISRKKMCFSSKKPPKTVSFYN